MRLAIMIADPEIVMIGGEPQVAPKLRVVDIGRLERWFAWVAGQSDNDSTSISTNDSTGIGANPATPSLPTPHQFHDQAPRFGSEAASRLLNSGEGFARLVLASLGQRIADLTIVGAREIARSMDEVEQARFIVAIYPKPPKVRPNQSKSDKPMDFHGAILWLMERYQGTVPADYFDMPLDQFFSLFEDPAQADEDGSGRVRRRYDYPIGSVADFEAVLDMLEKEKQEQEAMAAGQGAGAVVGASASAGDGWAAVSQSSGMGVGS